MGEQLDMRKDVQQIFMKTPHDKQVMMFSATLAKEIRPVCKKFCQDAMEIYVDDEAKLTLHGLQQYFIKLEEAQKNRKQRPSRRARVQPGHHLRLEGDPRHRAQQAAGRVQLPV